MDLREELTKAGNTFDGHVTNGSIEEQLKVIYDWFRYPGKYADGFCNHPPSSVGEHEGITICFRCLYRSDMNLPGRIPLPEPVKKTVRTFIQEEN